ncbi:MAG: beta-propeller domain-containing protein, partial [Bacillota bacterium]|nr:beta-propeller domain-containing protein [Bacillota bacterium]
AKIQESPSPFSRRYYMKSQTGAPVAENSDADGRSGQNPDYSKTNIQVEGVDEADIIKTDGRYLYLVANYRLYVVDAADPAAMKVVFSQKFNPYSENEKVITSESPLELYLDVENQRLVLVISGSISEKYIPEPEPTPEETKPDETTPEETKPDETTSDTPTGSDGSSTTSQGSGSGSDGAADGQPDEGVAPDETEQVKAMSIAADRMWYPYYNTRSYTSTRVYDISNPENPVMVRQFTQDGYYLTSRMIGTAVYVVTNRYEYRMYDAAVKDLKPEEILPSTCEVPGEDDWVALPPDRITILPEGDISNQTILAAIDTQNSSQKPDVLSILGSTGSVYASAKYLYVAAWNYDWDGKENSTPTYSTDLYRFKLSAASINEAGKGSVPGSIINQFSMDEHLGYFRIATTTGDTWNSDNPSKNNLYILDGSLNIVGKVTGLAPGETIKSVRFMGDQAYVVTFRTVDPLFVIDLADPKSPEVLGELKIPGYSTYLHPYDENLLLGFGYDVMTEGDRAFNLGMKVSLFDISDFNNPREVSTIILGSTGSYAEVLYNHKSLLFSRDKNIIAFPATLTKADAKDPRIYTQPNYQGLIVLGLDADQKLVFRGSITHFDKLADPFGAAPTLSDKDYQAFYGYDSIYRSAYIGDTLFTFSGRQVRSAKLDDFSAVGKVELPGFDDQVTYGYYRGIDIVD